MVQNPLSLDQHTQIEGLLQRCANLKTHCGPSLISSVEDVEVNLDAYLASDEGVWPEYRQTVPFDYILREFRGRITEWESTNPSTDFTNAHAVLEQESFNPDFLLDKNAVRFVGNPKKAARLLDKNVEGHNLSVVETDGGGVFVKLGSAFRGRRHIGVEDFTGVFKKTWESDPALSELLKESVQASHVYAAEDEGFGGGFPTPPLPDTERGSGGIEDTSESSLPAELIRLIEDNRHLIPPKAKEIISEQIIQISLLPDDPDPDPQPPKRLWKLKPPDPAMTRIDSYNIVESGRPTAPDGFAWSITGLSGQENIFQQSQLATWPNFSIVSGQKAVRRVQTEPSAPEGWYVNELLPQKCSIFQNQFLQRIPSLSADAIVLGYSFHYPPTVDPPEKVRFFKDSADGLYMEIQDFDPALHSKGSWQVSEAAPPYYEQIVDENGLFDCSITFKDYKGGTGHQYADYANESEILKGNGIADGDKVLADQTITEDSEIGDAIFTLYEWLSNWGCGKEPRGGGDIIDQYLTENIGACRHRTYIMFLALNRLGLPCRMNGSTSHAWPEIWNPTTGAWVQVNLGGCEDPSPDECREPCERKNPRYGVRRDGVLLKCCPEGYHMEGESCVPNKKGGDNVEPIDCEMCIPVVCAEGYYCHPMLNRCIPDCQTMFGPDYHYMIERDECVDCKEEGEMMVYDPGDEFRLPGCKCMDCPEGYSMNEEKYCVNDEGEVSGDVPKGYYFDEGVQQCVPREDCEAKMPGTVFNEFTALCECPSIWRKNDEGRDIMVRREWDENLQECAEKFECDEGQEVYYDPIMGDYLCRDIIPDDVPPDDSGRRTDKPSDKEKEEDVDEGEKELDIDPDAPNRLALKWVDLEDGTELYTDPGNTPGDWFKMERQKSLRLKGRNSQGQRYEDIWQHPDLYGLWAWFEQDANKELISVSKPKVGKNQYRILVNLNNERGTEAEDHWENLWVQSIKSDDGIREIGFVEVSESEKPNDLAFPNGRAIVLFHNNA